MARYFVECRYNGTRYHGWQRQPQSTSVQQVIEEAFAVITREQITIVGCGRTDTGVHASQYYFHFDTAYEDVTTLIYKANRRLGGDVLLVRAIPTGTDVHARFDAAERGYTYYITTEQDPFRQETAYYHYRAEELDIDQLNKAAAILVGRHSFDSFCKSNTDVKTKICTVTESRWTKTTGGYEYTVRADRFLRGMIRLIVGMCINVSRGRLELADVEADLKEQRRLSLDWSVPAEGLFLDVVKYPFIED